MKVSVARRILCLDKELLDPVQQAETQSQARFAWRCRRQELRSRFASLVRMVHPDLGGDEEAFLSLMSAYRAAGTDAFADAVWRKAAKKRQRSQKRVDLSKSVYSATMERSIFTRMYRKDP